MEGNYVSIDRIGLIKSRDNYIAKLDKLIMFFLTFILMPIFFSNTAKADIISPPTDAFWSPFTIGVFFGNMFLNFIVFGIGYLIFIERNVHKINKKSFFITIFLITLFGFLADSVALLFRDVGFLIVAIIIAAFLIFFFNYLICRFYLKLIKKKSFILGVWMSIFTNPFLYIIFVFLLTLLLMPFTPYTPIFPT